MPQQGPAPGYRSPADLRRPLSNEGSGSKGLKSDCQSQPLQDVLRKRRKQRLGTEPISGAHGFDFSVRALEIARSSVSWRAGKGMSMSEQGPGRVTLLAR